VAGAALIARIEHDVKQTLDRFNERVRPYVDDVVRDAGAARALQRDLEPRARRHREAGQQIVAARRELSRTTTEIQRIDRDREAIFTGLGLEPGDETTLTAWLDQRDRYQSLRQEVRGARIARDRLADQLGDHPQWLERDRAALESDREQSKREAEELDTIGQEIWTTRETRCCATARGRSGRWSATRSSAG